jgi:hypothetical protein
VNPNEHKESKPHGQLIGNGGQGIEIDGALFTRDLYERGVHRNPFVGIESDPEMRDRILNLRVPEGFHFNRALLANKLTEMNGRFSGLGDHVFRALRRYEWSLIDVPLPRTDECGDAGQGVSVQDWVQIANRVRDTIYVNRKNWQLLSEIGQVSLLIHEGLYSLLKPIPGIDGAYRQDGAQARRLAGAFFDEMTFRNGAENSELQRDLENLSLPEFGNPVRRAEWHLSRTQKEPGESDSIRVPLHRIQSNLDFFASSLRGNLSQWLKSPRTESISSVLLLESHQTRFRAYPTAQGFEQFALEIHSNEKDREKVSAFRGGTEGELQTFLDSTFRTIAENI